MHQIVEFCTAEFVIKRKKNNLKNSEIKLRTYKTKNDTENIVQKRV